MANAGSIANQIGESFEHIGKDIVSETIQAPKDIVGKALESLGSGSSNKKAGQKTTTSKTSINPTDTAAMTESGQTNSEEIKQAIARAALVELAGGKKSQEPSDYDKKLQEEEQKKQEKEQKKKAASMILQPQSSKRKRGDLYGLKAKKSSTEIGKNVRQD
ncbi:MAG: hypothetical protein AAB492_03535 [Patescibacteria group bacterium]